MCAAPVVAGLWCGQGNAIIELCCHYQLNGLAIGRNGRYEINHRSGGVFFSRWRLTNFHRLDLSLTTTES